MSIDRPDLNESPQVARPPRIVFFGRRCVLSQVPLERIVAQGLDVAAIFLATSNEFGPPVRLLSTRKTIPLMAHGTPETSQTIDALSRRHQIPLYELRRPVGRGVADLTREIAPDLIVVSCFPWRLAREIASAASLCTINFHPSPLPKFRGPDPLFWAFRTAAHDWGVTVHRITDSLDSGPILGQRPMYIPDGIPGDEFERHAAEIGGALLAQVMVELAEHRAEPIEQDDAAASYRSFPRQEDLVIDRCWSVRHALNFVAGVIPLGYAPIVKADGHTYEITGATEVEVSETAGRDNQQPRQRMTVRLADGSIRVEIDGRHQRDAGVL